MARTGYQLLSPSPWPISVSLCIMGFCSSLLIFCSEGSTWVFWVDLICSFSCVGFCLLNWWWDVVVESTYLGEWSSYVLRSYSWGFRLFIISEIFFFLGLLGSYIYVGVGEMSIQGVGFWPPMGVKPLDPGKGAFLCSGVLIWSSFSATWALKAIKVHNSVHSLMNEMEGYLLEAQNTGKNTSSSKDEYSDTSVVRKKYYSVNFDFKTYFDGLLAFIVTIVAGFCFTCLQAKEYYWCSYTFADSVYGSIFFMLTGFHGLHVIVGTVFLTVTCIRFFFLHFIYSGFYFGAWASVWYWHFVDGVWVFVYLLVYVWGAWGV